MFSFGLWAGWPKRDIPGLEPDPGWTPLFLRASALVVERRWPGLNGKRSSFKRAGFVLMAALAVHDKQADDREFLRFLEIIKNRADDDRNFGKKAVNWALRQIGKRNRELNGAAVPVAGEVYRSGTKAAKWIAADALRELRSEGVQRRLGGGEI